MSGENSLVQEAVNLLGLKGKDKVTGFSGVIASVHLDLYGCVQVILTPPVGTDGKLPNGSFFDIQRIEVSDERVMPVPDFTAMATKAPGETPKPADYRHGPTEKPDYTK